MVYVVVYYYFDRSYVQCMSIHVVAYTHRALYGCDEDGKRLAVSTFVANKQFYHSVAAGLLEKDLALSESS